MTGALRVLEHHLTVYRRTWKGSVFMSFVSPLLFLTGLAFGAPIFAFTATQRTDTSFALIGRLLITPLFLLGGVFFPIHQLPQLVQGIAWITPLAHGVALARGLAVGAASPTAGIH